LHKGKYLALCQRSAPVTVIRDDMGEDTGMFGINQHMGSTTVVSSLGCQTIPPSQYKGDDGFIASAQKIAKKYFGDGFKQLSYTYVLVQV
jgi:lysozyme